MQAGNKQIYLLESLTGDILLTYYQLLYVLDIIIRLGFPRIEWYTLYITQVQINEVLLCAHSILGSE